MEELNIDIKSFFKDLACEYIHVCKSDYLFKQGEGGIAIYFINEGAVKIIKGKSVLWIAEKNELIGISSFFESQGDFKFSAQACEELDAIRIEPDKFKELLSANPAFGIKIINMLCERIKMTNERLRNVLNQSSKSRLISEIVSISKRTSSLKIEISTDELSQLIGISKRLTRSILMDLEKKMLVLRSKNSLTIQDLKGLNFTANNS